jgi:predicted regulator of Ras-like GTPase activity (Roadblock/LC7/MglB family)
VTDSHLASTDPGHAFLDLGERLRIRGQLEAALSVALAGAGRYPGLAAAHDLVGRIRVDLGDDDGARSAWIAALECDRGAVGALKGLAFLAFRRQDFAEAERRLEAAALEAPHDATILAALDRVRASQPVIRDDIVRFDAPDAGVLLFDGQGLRLAGHLAGADDASADIAAAAGIGLVREGERASRLLDLGECRHLLVESARARLVAAPVAPHGGVLLHRPATAPAGRVVAMAERAVQAARAWLEQAP